MSGPNPQNPNDSTYVIIDSQPLDQPPSNPDSSPSNFTYRQYTPTNITNAYPVIVTIDSHGLVPGQGLMATQFISMPFASATGMIELNNKTWYVQNPITTNTFALADRSGKLINGTNFTPYIQGGQLTLTGPSLPIVNPSPFPPNGLPFPWIPPLFSEV